MTGTVPSSLTLDTSEVGLDGEESKNVLVLLREGDLRADVACAGTMALAPCAELNAITVTLDQSPDERLTVWRTHGDHRLPAKNGIVTLEDHARSVSKRIDDDEAESTSIVTIDSPTDLPTLGIKVSDFLSEWQEDAHRTVLCFHTLTTLLQHVEQRRAFRFLNVLSGRLDSANAVAHYHLDPDVIDAETVTTIRTLMDVVIEDDGEGGMSITEI